MTPRPPIAALLLTTLLLSAASRSAARDMATDRPDATESPVSVAPGRWQLELDVVALTREPGGARTWQAAVLNLKRGLTARQDVQVLLAPLNVTLDPDALGGGSDQGPVTFGLRFKQNLAGAEGGAFSIALLPWITSRTGEGPADEKWVAALAVPMAADLGSGFGGGAMLQAASVHDGGSRATWWTATATVGRTLAGALGAYVEGIATSRCDDLAIVSTTASLGLTYRPGPDLQFDAGVRTGLVRDDADVIFAGLSVRR